MLLNLKYINSILRDSKAMHKKNENKEIKHIYML